VIPDRRACGVLVRATSLDFLWAVFVFAVGLNPVQNLLIAFAARKLLLQCFAVEPCNSSKR